MTPATKEGLELIDESTRAELRHLHIVEGVPKKELARRFGVDIKTVRRHVREGEEYAALKSPKRRRALDDHRAEIQKLLEGDAKLSAKRIGRLLQTQHGIHLSARSIRRYVEEMSGTVRKPEAFVHRTHLPGETMEIDFGETWREIDGRRTKIFFFVATLPASNVYLAKAYRHQRVECLLDGLSSAIRWIGSVPPGVVFDNASTAVKRSLNGEERIETEMFHRYRAELALGADFCNPASGWEKGSAERGVQYVRRLALSVLPPMKDLDELNPHILCELDLDRRSLRDGTGIRQAFAVRLCHDRVEIINTRWKRFARPSSHRSSAARSDSRASSSCSGTITNRGSLSRPSTSPGQT